MTTSRTAFVLFLAAFVPAISAPAAIGQAPVDKETSRVIRLPAEQAPPLRGPLERLDGRHLHWAASDVADPTLGLGPVIPTRMLTSVIERRVDQAGGRDAGISVEPLGPFLLLRGGAAGGPGAIQGAVKAANDTVQEFQAMAEGLRFRTRVRLLSGASDGSLDAGPIDDGPLTAEAADSVVLIDESMVLTSGDRGAFGSRVQRPVVADFDVEVAASASIADPVNAVVETGETVHLWASTVLDSEGHRRLHLQGLLDVASEGPSRTFDPDVYELGELEQPTIRSTQVLFASTVLPGEPLVVTLEGLRAEQPRRRLEITAEALTAGTPSMGTPSNGEGSVDPDGASLDPYAARVVDLSRGMWRSALAFPHALGGDSLQVAIPEARMPASAAQLITLIFGREASARPDLGSSVVLLPGENEERDRDVQALFESVDPVGPAAVLTVASSEDGFRATLPAARGALLRVAHIEETVLIVDYDPQIASEAVLSDPRAEFSLSGSVFECAVEWSQEGFRLEGFAHRRAITGLTVRKADPVDVGRIQQPVSVTESSRIVLIGGGSTRGAGLDITLTQR
ncbi:hypothetical protein Poly30_31070 [Planctomycetes bacterium Poly30]|uniref:Bacterial type II and III secretion system protein n=1 Tax=Saltatorellus ferox TaxID=2528018 RepID=A0A518EU23_9BACT|nr:hypothetical protein Poly30_31070 [Planctomycetes bacterium Poly30]